MFLAYLGVKGIPIQLVETLELLAVGLVHGEGVLLALEDLHLVGLLGTAPGEVALHGDGDGGGPLGVGLLGSPPRRLLLVGVVVDDQGQPQGADLLVMGAQVHTEKFLFIANLIIGHSN